MVGFSPCLTAWPNKVSVTCSVILLTALFLGWAFPRYECNVTKEPGGLRCFCRPLHGQCMDLYPQILHGVWVPWSCPDFSVSCTWHIHTPWPFVPQVCLVLSHLAVYTAFNWCYALYTRYKNCSCHLSSLSIQLEITLLCISHSLSQECVNNGLSLKEKETFSLLFSFYSEGQLSPKGRLGCFPLFLWKVCCRNWGEQTWITTRQVHSMLLWSNSQTFFSLWWNILKSLIFVWIANAKTSVFFMRRNSCFLASLVSFTARNEKLR